MVEKSNNSIIDNKFSKYTLYVYSKLLTQDKIMIVILKYVTLERYLFFSNNGDFRQLIDSFFLGLILGYISIIERTRGLLIFSDCYQSY